MSRHEVSADKDAVSVRAGATQADSAAGFGMMRNGKVGIAVASGMQVLVTGKPSSWMPQGSLVKGMDGAADLVHGAGREPASIEHVANDGSFKLVEECSLPLTDGVAVQRVTDSPSSTPAQGVMVEEVRGKTEPEPRAEGTRVRHA